MASYLKKEISEWNTSELCNWLLDNKFRGISELFQKYSISGYDLFYINDDILKNELGLSSFHERKVTLKLISKLTYEHLKLNIINSNGDNVILTLDNNHETSLEEISDYIGNMFNIDSKNILFKDSSKQEVLSPTVKIIKLLILYPKIYKTLYVSNMKDYHQVDEEFLGSGMNSESKIDNNNNNNIKFNSIGTMEQSMNEREMMNNDYSKNKINEMVYQNNENNQNNLRENNSNNYKYNNINFNNRNNKNNDNSNYLINSGFSNMMNNDDDMDIKNDKYNLKPTNQNTNANMMNNLNTNTSENMNNENRERMYKSEKRVYRTVNDFNQKKKNNENYPNMPYEDNEITMSSGNEDELKFKPSYQIKKNINNNNLNKDNYFTFQNNNNVQKTMEQRGRQGDYISGKINENKAFYKNKVFNEDFIDDHPNYNKIANN
jgi:hypothetical protein